MYPQFPNPHPVFDRMPTENIPSPVSKGRLSTYQKQINRIAGLASNGKPNVRVIWAADPNEAISMHVVAGEKRARYCIGSDEYVCTRTSPVSGLEIVEHITVDLCLNRFVFEQYHTPEEQEYNPAPPDANGDNDGYYTHLFTVAYHDETCCDGRESVNGSLCFGAYQEPSDAHLDLLRRLIQMRDAELQHRMIGERLSAEELAQDLRRVRHWRESRDIAWQSGYEDVALQSLRLHGWRMSNTDAGKRSKFHFLEGH